MERVHRDKIFEINLPSLRDRDKKTSLKQGWLVKIKNSIAGSCVLCLITFVSFIPGYLTTVHLPKSKI
jgi:hypothetical protein